MLVINGINILYNFLLLILFLFFFKSRNRNLPVWSTSALPLPPHSGSPEHFTVTLWCDLVGSVHLRQFPATFYWYSIFLSVCFHGNWWTFQSLSAVPYTNSPPWLICSWCSALRGYRLTKSFLHSALSTLDTSALYCFSCVFN